MAKEVILLPTPTRFPPGIPAGIPYSPGTRDEDYIFVSGQVGSGDSKGRELKGVEAQTRQALESMKQILEAAGASLSDVLKTNVFLVNAGDFAGMNKVYQEYFPKDCPARSTVIVAGLVKPEMMVEIECIARRPHY